VQRTLAIIKPDGVAAGQTGEVIRRYEGAGFRILGLRLIQLTRAQAEGFYAVHRERPFFGSLCDFMTEGPVVVVALEGESAITRLRELMGATDPAKAALGTIRKDLATSIERNVVHGSDSPESAAMEIPYFFSALDLRPAQGAGR
jgi:nucleoside-diphosphate kinase